MKHFDRDSAFTFYHPSDGNMYEVHFTVRVSYSPGDHNSWASDWDYAGFVDVDSVDTVVFLDGEHVNDNELVSFIEESPEYGAVIDELLRDL
jgi:hypothetical protein